MDAAASVPKFVFIVPYRDREPHRVFFNTYIYKIMEDIPPEDWTFFFIHQNDKRPFNRGAMKNIGFLALKNAYPNDYKNIIFIFNDVDTLPYTKNILNYETDFGVIKHFYGFHFALGGIFSIRGADFERINGFPNYWAWGGEDNLIHERAKQNGLFIDRSNFYTIGNMNILQFADGLKRLICRDELATSIMPNNVDGLSKITDLKYMIYNDTHMIDVTSFDTYISYLQLHFEEQTLDKVSKLRVSPLNAVRNIKELNSDYFVDVNNRVHSIESAKAGGGAGLSVNRPIELPKFNTVNQHIQPKMPFTVDLGNVKHRNFTMLSQQDRPIPATESASNGNGVTNPAFVNRVYQNFKGDQNVVIPLQRPSSATAAGAGAVGLQGHKRFGMRAMFM
jgi:hypothetical protein